VDPSRFLRLALVADTHGRPDPRALAQIAAARPDAIVHAGDVGGAHVVAALDAIAPTYAVRGNVDPAGAWPEAIALALGPYGTLLVTHVAEAGAAIEPRAHDAAVACGARLVVGGHSHRPRAFASPSFGLVNPGSIGPRRFRLPVAFALVELDPAGGLATHLDVATGLPLEGTSPATFAVGSAP
jgi:putative phosphoesterase